MDMRLYEPPTLVEMGSFTELTRGNIFGTAWDHGPINSYWYTHG
jgi:hypothetical protein